MRLVTRQEFLMMPKGTVFAKGVRWDFGEIKIKLHTYFDNDGLPIDFVFMGLFNIQNSGSEQMFDRYEEMILRGVSYPLEVYEMRDGCLDDEELFMIYEKNDVKEIITILEGILL